MLMLAKTTHFLQMIRFSHTLFALPFALLGAVMAWTAPVAAGPTPGFRWQDLAGILVCMVSARSAAMAFNRLADQVWDAANPRTRMRHLPTGVLSLWEVRGFMAASAALFVASTLWFLPNWLPLLLSVPVLLFVMGYSYAKRFTSLSHVWLGAALMLAPVAAWLAIRGLVVWQHPADAGPAFVLGLAVLCWVSGFDMIYACQDVAFDRQAKLHSIPARWGVPRALRMAAACHLLMIVPLAALPWCFPQLGLGWPYGLAIAAVAVLLVIEHSLVKAHDLDRVNTAFFHVNAVISLGLFIVGSWDLLT